MNAILDVNQFLEVPQFEPLVTGVRQCTILGNIPLPPNFVLVLSDDPYCVMYADASVFEVTLQKGILAIKFSDFNNLVVTFGNKRRRGMETRKEVNFARGTEKSKKMLLADVVRQLISHDIDDGHDAFVYAPVALCKNSYSPLCVFPEETRPDTSWRLILVIEKT